MNIQVITKSRNQWKQVVLEVNEDTSTARAFARSVPAKLYATALSVESSICINSKWTFLYAFSKQKENIHTQGVIKVSILWWSIFFIFLCKILLRRNMTIWLIKPCYQLSFIKLNLYTSPEVLHVIQI